MKRPFRLRGKKKREKEKKGGAVVGSGSVASSEVGSHIATSLGTAAPGGLSVSPWTSVVTAVSKATGLSIGVATNAGVAAMILGISTAVAAFSLYMGSDQESPKLMRGGEIFSVVDGERMLIKTPSYERGAAMTSGHRGTEGSSLDYLSGANRQRDDSLDGVGDEVKQAPAETPAPEPEKTVTDVVPASKKKERKSAGPKPKLKASKFRSKSGPALTSKITLVKLRDVEGSGGGFDAIYKAAKTAGFDGQKRPNYGARGRTAVNTGGNAYGQAKFANRMSGTGTRMGKASAAAAYASRPFDGSNVLGGTSGNIGADDGRELGGSGIGSSANSIRNSKSVTLPPLPEVIKNAENKTPYQGILLAATAALMIGMILLKAAGQMIKQSKTPSPDSAAQLAMGKALAMAAMAAGGASAGIGGVLAGQYDQLAQAIPFIIGGGALALEAGMVLAKADQAGEDAELGITQAAQQAGQLAQQAIGDDNDKVSPEELDYQRRVESRDRQQALRDRRVEKHN